MGNITGDEPANAFVDNRSSSYEDNEVHYGLTIRQHFAAMAMQGILSNEQFCKNLSKVMEETRDFLNDTVESRDKFFFQNLASASVQATNALITELNKPK